MSCNTINQAPRIISLPEQQLSKSYDYRLADELAPILAEMDSLIRHGFGPPDRSLAFAKALVRRLRQVARAVPPVCPRKMTLRSPLAEGPLRHQG